MQIVDNHTVQITLLNYTGKDINHFNNDMTKVLMTIPTQGKFAIEEKRTLKFWLGDIPVYEQTHGEVYNLPEPVENTVIILPFLLAKSDYVKGLNRNDILIPSQTVKENGKVIGFKSFSLA